MDSKEIKQLIQNGEKIDVEFKESKMSIPDGFTPPVRSWKPSIPV